MTSSKVLLLRIRITCFLSLFLALLQSHHQPRTGYVSSNGMCEVGCTGDESKIWDNARRQLVRLSSKQKNNCAAIGSLGLFLILTVRI